MMDELPQAVIELTQGASSPAATPRRCSILVEESDVMFNRRMPEELIGILGFIDWNRFCDHLDASLQSLRNLAEAEKSKQQKWCGFKEQAAKTTSLESLQKVCDKLSKKFPALHLVLYCPFHSPLVRDWHIQVTILPDAFDQAAPAATGTADLLPMPSQASDSTAGDSNGTELGDGINANSSSNHDSEESKESPNQEQEILKGRVDDATNNKDICTFYSSEGKGVLGVDYIEHKVLPTDTLGGICLHYNISLTRLKQANLMNGDHDSLLLAPKILAIPISEGYFARFQDTESEDFKLNAMTAEFPKLGRKEAKAYLELADWVLDDAIKNVRDDIAWEKVAKDDF